MSVRMLHGDCRQILRTLPDESVHCVVTSPPYWSLRDYNIPGSIWGGSDTCEHAWGDEITVNATNHTDKVRWNHTRNGRDEEQPKEKRVSWLRMPVKQGQFCGLCGAWFGAHGLEPTPQLYVENEVLIFRDVRRVLRADGTLWLNLGDSYAGSGRGGNPTRESSTLEGSKETQEASMVKRTLGNQLPPGFHAEAFENGAIGRAWVPAPPGMKQKDLMGMPWRVAFALQADGWWLRQDIIWSKPNPMPESVTDRCTKAHEYLFLLSKSESYYYDQDAILEECSPNTHARLSQDVQNQVGSERAHAGGKTNGNMKAVARRGGGNRTHKAATAYENGADEHRTKVGLVAFADRQRKLADAGSGTKNNESMDAALAIMPIVRNKRSVWSVATQPFKEAHFATFPPALIEPCILAGCPEGGGGA